MKTKYLSFLLAGIVSQSFGLVSPVLAGFYVIPVSRSESSTLCTGPDEVLSAGQCWKDRNLGASQVATSSVDSAAFGDLYQWGRLGIGHQNRTSLTISTLSANDIPGHNQFIVSTTAPYDWRSPQNDNLWQGLSSVNNPCPQGFRLPTEAEFETERASWISNNADGAFASPLKLAMGGWRRDSDGVVKDEGNYGGYWTSTASTTYARDLIFSDNNARMNTSDRADGYSIRCIKD